MWVTEQNFSPLAHLTYGFVAMLANPCFYTVSYRAFNVTQNSSSNVLFHTGALVVWLIAVAGLVACR